MSIGGFMDKAKAYASEHPDQVDQAVEKGGDAVDARTGGEYASQVDGAQEKATGFLGGGGAEQPEAPPAEGDQPQR